jgi:hypothetical protein
MIAAWAGDKQLACEQVDAAMHLPRTLSYGELKLLPYWDLLRGDARFEKIVADLAPKQSGAVRPSTRNNKPQTCPTRLSA